MADYFTTPKVDWEDTDGIGYEDLNRMEQNTSAVRDGTKRRVQGFGYTMSNVVPNEDGVITVTPGSCFSNNGVPINMSANFVKNLDSWAQGNGSGVGGMAPDAHTAGVDAHTWYYIFAITNPINGDVEIMFDDNPAGTNVSNVVFTEKRLVGTFKTITAGVESSFYVAETYSDGDHTYINPTGTPYVEGTQFLMGGLAGNVYNHEQLLLSGNPVLPAIVTRADLNLILLGQTGSVDVYIGLVNSVVFSVPANFSMSGTYRGEWIGLTDASNDWASFDVELLMDPTSELYIAVSGGVGTLEIRVKGFHWDRLI